MRSEDPFGVEKIIAGAERLPEGTNPDLAYAGTAHENLQCVHQREVRMRLTIHIRQPALHIQYNVCDTSTCIGCVGDRTSSLK